MGQLLAPELALFTKPLHHTLLRRQPSFVFLNATGQVLYFGFFSLNHTSFLRKGLRTCRVPANART